VDWIDVVPHLTGLTHIATSDAAGHPAVAIVSALVVDDDVWFQARRTSTKVRNLLENPSIALMWQPAGEAYVWGDATVIDDVDVKRRWWPDWHYDAAEFFGSPDDPGVVVVRVTPARATVLVGGDSGPERLRWGR
jgi:general stress protein 26